MDRCEAQDLGCYHPEFGLERRERDPGSAGLSHSGLEAPDAGSNCTLPDRHGYLVVSPLLGGHSLGLQDVLGVFLLVFQVAARVCPMAAGHWPS